MNGDAAKVSTLLSTPGARSFITYQGELGSTPRHDVAARGHKAVATQLLAARCDVDLHNGFTAMQKAVALLQANNGFTALQAVRARGTRSRHADTEQKAQKC